MRSSTFNRIVFIAIPINCTRSVSDSNVKHQPQIFQSLIAFECDFHNCTSLLRGFFNGKRYLHHFVKIRFLQLSFTNEDTTERIIFHILSALINTVSKNGFGNDGVTKLQFLYP